MRKLTLSLIFVLILGSLSAAAVMADDDDNNPRQNPHANACFEGGSMEGQCDTLAEWQAGWFLIRYEQEIFTMADIPGWANWSLPEAHDALSGFIPGYDFGAPDNPNTGAFGGTAPDPNAEETDGGNVTPPPPPEPTTCYMSIPATMATAWGTQETRTVSTDFVNGLVNTDGNLEWVFQPGDAMMGMQEYWFIKLNLSGGQWVTMYTFDGQPRWGEVSDTDCPTPVAPQQVP